MKRLLIPSLALALSCQCSRMLNATAVEAARRAGGRAVDGSGLENQRVFTGTVGSNHTLSVRTLSRCSSGCG